MKRFLIALTLLLAAGIPAGAATLTVTNANDDGSGSLRQAVRTANASAGQDNVINVNASVKSISLLSMITIESGVTINGNGVTLKGSESRIFNITSGTARFDRVTFTGGKAANENGGAVNVSGSASAQFTNCTFFGNSAGAYGGAVCVNSSSAANNTTFRNCTIAGNTATNGGGVAVTNGIAAFSATIVAGNHTTLGAEDDVYRVAGTGAITAGSYNVVGTALNVEDSSFSGSRHNHTGAAISDVLVTPVALETVNDTQVLKLSTSTRNPALDLISKDVADMPAVDERGATRPKLLGYDAGAFEADPVAVESIALTGSSYIQQGGQETYTVRATPVDASRNKNYPDGVEWGVSDTSVLSVSGGVVTALKVGTATLSARLHGWDAKGSETVTNSASLQIHVGSGPLPAPTVSIDEIKDQSLATEKKQNLTPKVRISLDGFETQIPYTLFASPSNTTVAAVEVTSGDTLILTGKEPGSSDITVTVTASNSAGTGRDERHFVLTVTKPGSGGGHGGCNTGLFSGLGAGVAGLLAAALTLRRRG